MSNFFRMLAIVFSVFCVITNAFLLVRGVSVLSLTPLVVMQVFAVLVIATFSRDSTRDEIPDEGKKA